MFVRRQSQDNLFQIQDAAAFISRDLCALLMKKLYKHDPAVYRHSIRVALLSKSVAEVMGLDPAQQTVFFRSALLHDIGKLTISAEWLRGKTTSLDRARQLEQHPEAGAELLEDFIAHGLVMPEVILHHHENLDGSGYPFGKTERDLTLPVRIVRVADSYDADVYCPGNSGFASDKDALNDLYRWSDICYDAEVVKVFHAILRRRGREPQW